MFQAHAPHPLLAGGSGGAVPARFVMVVLQPGEGACLVPPTSIAEAATE